MSRRRVDDPPWGGLPSGATVLVDTAPLIYLLDGHPGFAPRFAGLFQAIASGQLAMAVTSITLDEVMVGPLQAGNEMLAQRYEQQLLLHRVVPLDAGLAARAARLRARHRLKLPDAVQLAAALHIGAAALVTHDRDYAGIDTLPILFGEEP